LRPGADAHPLPRVTLFTMLPRALGSVLAALLAAGVSVAATTSVPPLVRDPTQARWLRLETPNFTFLGEVPEARLRAIAARLEAFRGTLETLHPGSTGSPRQTSIYVFASAANGRSFTGHDAGGTGHLGVNPPYDVGNYVAVAAPVDDPPLEILYHSYAHQFLDDGFPRLPLLVTEGLAGFYTGFTVIPEGTLVGMVNSDHVQWMRQHADWSLNALLGLDAAALHYATTIEQQTFIAGSWVFMHYLVSGSGDARIGVPVFLAALQRGTQPDDAAQAGFGTNLDGLQAAVTRYVQANRFLAMRITDPKARPDAGAWRATPMTRDAILAALGDLIVHVGPERDAEAEAYFRAALQLNPDQARAHSGMGYLRYARGRYAEAIPALEKAVEIDADAMPCYLLARSILRINARATVTAGAPPPWMARARLLLARATTLRPGFAAPYVTLGTTHIRPDGDPRAGIEMLEKARALLPARTDIAGNLVYLYLRTGDLARAQAMTERVIAPSGDAQALQAARAAVATYKEDVAARKSLERKPLTPAEEAGARAIDTKMIQVLRDSLKTMTDPATRERIESEIASREAALQPGAKSWAEIYNEAIAHANKREYTEAIAMLEDLLKEKLNPDLAEQVKTTLDRLRQDAARFEQTVP